MTGVRFVKKLRVIHVEVEQAKALPEGKYYQGIVSNNDKIDHTAFTCFDVKRYDFR